jgi:hypothetical protein
LQRISIGVNVLLVPHLLGAFGFRWTVLLAAGISVALIPYAVWGRRYEPAGRSIDLASDDRLLVTPGAATAEPAITSPSLGLVPSR